jgi:hypothetical protein
LGDPLIASDAVRLGELYAQLTEAEEKVRRLYDRWAELEALRERLSQEEGGERGSGFRRNDNVPD